MNNIGLGQIVEKVDLKVTFQGRFDFIPSDDDENV